MFNCCGMTELAGCLTTTSIFDRNFNTIGGVLPCARMQLRDLPHLKFYTDSNPPIGEVYLKGNSCFKGYFKNPKLTAETIDSDGWLKVGDVGILRKNGSIEIVDRVQEMKKLQNGQFISPSKLEGHFITAPMVNQLCIIIDSRYMFLTAVIHLHSEKLQQFADVNGFKQPLKELLKIKDVEIGVLKQLERIAKDHGLSEIEQIKRVVFAPEPFSFANGCLTNTNKMIRSAIGAKYAEGLKEAYTSDLVLPYKVFD